MAYQEPSTLYSWSNLCPNLELFLEMYFPWTSVSTAARVWPKSTLKKMAAKAKSRILRPFSSTISPFRVDFGHLRTAAETRSRETILKIAQSGYRLSLRLIMRDGRSRWWAPGLTREISHYFSCPRYQQFTVSNILISNLTIRTLDHEDDATFFSLAKCKGLS